MKWQGFFAERFPDWEVVALDRSALAPLQVALEQPMDQARVASERIVVAGKVSGGKGVARVLATLNGVEVFTQEEWQEEGQSANNEVTLNFPITLREGKNVLLVTAADPEGYTVQAARTLFYGQSTEPPPPRSAVPSDYRGHRPAPVPLVFASLRLLPVTAATSLLPFQVAEVTPLPALQITIASPRDEARLDQQQYSAGRHGGQRQGSRPRDRHAQRHGGRAPGRADAATGPGGEPLPDAARGGEHHGHHRHRGGWDDPPGGPHGPLREARPLDRGLPLP